MFPGCDAAVYGHSHMPEVAREGDLLILNPGSPTERRRAPARSMLELDVVAGAFRAKVVTLSP
jgi:predicted phosphodiesterase